MTKRAFITAIFKRNLYFSELIKLLQQEGVKILIKNDFSSIKKVLSKTGIILLEIDSEKTLKKVSLDLKKKNRRCEVLCIFNDKYPIFENIKGIKAMYQPIMFNEFLRNILNLQKIVEMTSESINLGNLTFYPKSLELLNNENEKVVKLTELENKLIKFILKNKDGVTKTDLLLNVWKHKSKLNTHSLESLIYRLRRKIEKDPNNPDILKQTANKYFLNLKS